MNLAHWLARSATAYPRHPALFRGVTPMADYAHFDARARAVAGWLRAQGVAEGDRVALFMPNGPDYLIALYGIWYAGAAAVPINAKLHGREAAFILRDAGAKLVFVVGSNGAALNAEGDPVPRVDVDGPGYDDLLVHPPLPEPAPRDGSDMAWLFYTSGTTGTPKGVIITHDMLLSMALCYEVDVDRVFDGDAAIYAAPLSHGAGLYNLMHVRAGARHVFPESGGFDADEVLDLAAHHGRAHMFAAPTMVRRLLAGARAAGRRGEGLRTIVYGGGPMYNADIVAAVDWFGPVFVQIYGQGECPMGISALSRADVADRKGATWEKRLASVGRAQAAVELRIETADGQTAPAGTNGEIMVRGRTVMPGYWNAPEATARALKNGWLATGDIGSLDDAGYLTLQDRSKDVIITGGSNVYPREVEEVLLRHDAVQEVSVVGRPHDEWGEEIVAFVVGEAPDSELDALCLANMARFKRPKVYLRMEELPKNNYGKVLKTELRERLKPG